MKNNRKTYRMLAYFMQFSINMLVPIFLCAFGGYFIDKKFGTNCFFIILFFVGALAGFRNIYVLAKKIMKDSDEKTDK